MATKAASSKNLTEANPKPPQGNPNIDDATQGHSFHIQFAFDVNKQIGKIETALAAVEKRVDRVEVKLDAIQVDLVTLKTTAGHIEALFKTGVKALWAIAGGVTVFILGLLSLWLKHRLGW